MQPSHVYRVLRDADEDRISTHATRLMDAGRAYAATEPSRATAVAMVTRVMGWGTVVMPVVESYLLTPPDELVSGVFSRETFSLAEIAGAYHQTRQTAYAGTGRPPAMEALLLAKLTGEKPQRIEAYLKIIGAK